MTQNNLRQSMMDEWCVWRSAGIGQPKARANFTPVWKSGFPMILLKIILMILMSLMKIRMRRWQMVTSAGLSTRDQPEKMLPDIRITRWKWDCLQSFRNIILFVVVLIIGIVVCSTPHYQQILHIHDNLYEYIVCFETYFCNFRDSTSVASDILLSWRKS